ncbi:hypothetical protein [Xylanimonas ulmi]|uniref:Uncharacterized protein n=1 Tax=Xylanimonas ulmi TaxID=228973 RepID=A0A4Q7M4X6_9MICO|nr:hypothetical protein [Xylanibacterium ulmi]RZS61059.1 hypothetical protein EV386_1347 [Xylanibacterium ulmi]
MSTQPSPAPAADEAQPHARRLLQESLASAGRIALKQPAPAPDADPRAGGDASKAPTSLSAVELHPIEGDSSGKSWDDPDEL